MQTTHSNSTPNASRNFPRGLKAGVSAMSMVAIFCVAMSGFSTSSVAQGPDVRIVKPSANSQQLAVRSGKVMRQKQAGGGADQNGIAVPVCFLDYNNKPKCIVVEL